MKVLFIIVIMLFIGNSYLFSQEPTTCESCDDWHGPIVQTFDLSEELNCKTSITYSWEECNGVWEFKYEGVSFNGNCGFMDEFSIYQYNTNALFELIDLLIVQWWSQSRITPGGAYIVPNCPSTIQLLKVYSASCGVWVKCTYEVDPDSRECEQGYDAPYPIYGVFPGPYFLDHWKWQTCGEVCCEKTYTVCNTLHPISGNRLTNITAMSKNKVGLCTEEPGGSTPKYAKPCQDGCQTPN